MTLPHARKITVEGVEYSYILKSLGRPHRVGDGPGRVKLVVEMKTGEYVAVAFRSKTWTEDHENGEFWAPPHKVGFLPSDVALVILAVVFHGGDVPATLDLPAWRSIELKKPSARSAKGIQGPRRSISGHLDPDDLRAVVFEDPTLTVDYWRAELHVKSCEVCRGMVEREHAENLLLQPEGS
jgi:hypothetical protein